MQNIVKTLNRNEVYRYLGHRGTDIPQSLEKITDDCIEKTLEIIEPKYLYKRFKIDNIKDGIEVVDAGIILPGKDIAEHLGKCKEVFLLCVTLGIELDRLIKIKMLTEPDKGVIFDSCGSVAVEQLADYAEAEIKKICKKDGLDTTWRFSPGYGDLPITLQRDLLSVLDSHRKIGLTVTDSMLMTPGKSVSAIIGVGNMKTDKRENKCDYCGNRENCAFRRDNTRC